MKVMNKDIANRADIELFVQEFYQKLLEDSQLRHFFYHIVQKNDLSEHLETITDFWEDILFLTTNYGKNAMKPHIELHQKTPFKEAHFTAWLTYFNSTIDAHFEGKKATLAKQRALSIATVMKIKLKD